jgi:subtilisin family serine protease
MSPTIPESIDVTPASLEIEVGQTVMLSSVVRGCDGRTLSDPVQWSSANSTIASVDAVGAVAGHGEGTTTVKASVSSMSRNVPVTVVRGPNEVPIVEISAPADGAVFAAGTNVLFQGSAEDPEDGTLSGASLVWSANVPINEIGTGSSFSKTDLSVGSHTIILTATDSDGATNTAFIGITVELLPTEIVGTVTTVSGFLASRIAALDLDRGAASLGSNSRVKLGLDNSQLARPIQTTGSGEFRLDVPGELVVSFHPSVLSTQQFNGSQLLDQTAAASVVRDIDLRLSSTPSSGAFSVAGVSPAILAARIRVPEDKLEAVAASLRADPGVRSVTRSRIYSVIPRPVSAATAGLLTTFSNPWQAWHLGMVNAPEAWDITRGSSSVLVAVVDDGIRFDHLDVAPNLTSDGYDFVTNYGPYDLCAGGMFGLSGDGGGYDSDPTIPSAYEWDTLRECATPKTTGGHGLHVAGTIGATGAAASGNVGVAPVVRIRPVRAFDVIGGGTVYDAAQGLLYAAGLPADDGAGGIVQAAEGARVINASWGFPEDDAGGTLEQAVIAASQAGALIVAAAGNDGTVVAGVPAIFPQVLTVSSVGPEFTIASHSNFGPSVDVAAPGGDKDRGRYLYPQPPGNWKALSFGVMSSVWNFDTSQPADESWQGTSMAAPHVTGVAALVLASDPGLSATQLRDRITDFAVDAGVSGRDDLYGAGIVNARNSVTATFSPPADLFARLYDADSGSVIETTPTQADGSYVFPGLADGHYLVFAGEDRNGDGMIGDPLRRWGAFGGPSNPTAVTVSGPGSHSASFQIGLPTESEPNNSASTADLLTVGGYALGSLETADGLDYFKVSLPSSGTYTIETGPGTGACGLANEEDTVLRLFDSAGTKLGENDDRDFDAWDLCSQITMMLDAGVYDIEVTGYFGRESPYTIQVRAGS